MNTNKMHLLKGTILASIKEVPYERKLNTDILLLNKNDIRKIIRQI
jgi:hypothetical protein